MAGSELDSNAHIAHRACFLSKHCRGGYRECMCKQMITIKMTVLPLIAELCAPYRFRDWVNHCSQLSTHQGPHQAPVDTSRIVVTHVVLVKPKWSQNRSHEPWKKAGRKPGGGCRDGKEIRGCGREESMHYTQQD